MIDRSSLVAMPSQRPGYQGCIVSGIKLLKRNFRCQLQSEGFFTRALHPRHAPLTSSPLSKPCRPQLVTEIVRTKANLLYTFQNCLLINFVGINILRKIKAHALAITNHAIHGVYKNTILFGEKNTFKT